MVVAFVTVIDLPDSESSEQGCGSVPFWTFVSRRTCLWRRVVSSRLSLPCRVQKWNFSLLGLPLGVW